MTVNILSIDEIVSDPKVRGGRPVIAGTGITVMNIVGYHLYGDKLTPAEIADNFRLPLGQVHAALAYYYLHQDEMDEQIRLEIEETERLVAELEWQGKLLRMPVSIADEEDCEVTL